MRYLNIGRNTGVAAIAAAIIISAGSAAYAQSGQERVPFDIVPGAVQNALTDSGAGISSGAAATAWRRTEGNRIIYTGRLVDVDGSARVIDVDAFGRVLNVHQFGAPTPRRVDPGETVTWNTLPPAVQNTMGDAATGAPLTRIVRKTAANGMPIYVASTTDLNGNPLYIETTAKGVLIGLKRKPD
jgi:hypothetical protein